MNRVLVQNYLIYTLPIKTGHREELDMENIVLGIGEGGVIRRDKTREAYLENELEMQLNGAIKY